MRNFYIGLIFIIAAASALPFSFAFTSGGFNREARPVNSAIAPVSKYTNGTSGLIPDTGYALSMPDEA